MYNQATAYGQKPSDFFELETELGRWALDEACLRVGRHVENNLNNGKDAFEGFHMPKPHQGFRSAKALVKKKVKIKNGVW